MTVTAHDINHAALDISSNASITITTTPAVDSIISSPLSILAGTSSATFYLAQSTVSSIDINVTDGNSTELTGAAIASEDLPLNFTNTAFRFIDIASLSTLAIGKQIGSKPSSTAPGAQNIGLQAIRTDTQSGACTTAFANVNTAVNFAYECNNPSSCQPTIPPHPPSARQHSALAVNLLSDLLASPSPSLEILLPVVAQAVSLEKPVKHLQPALRRFCIKPLMIVIMMAFLMAIMTASPVIILHSQIML
nr:hypothetical protein [sulfur-oxidizing endosymbiont of Gigantopelta aegis]